MSVQRTINWLKAASAIVIGFGILTALGALPAASAPIQLLADLAFWPVDGTPASSAPEIRLLCAVAGGIMTGWGVLLWQLASRLYAREPELARGLILASIGTWFVIDSLGSIMAGAPVNAVFNIGFLALFAVPLARPLPTEAAG